MDLDNAFQTHAEWKTTFRSAILKKGTIDADMISKDDCCDFGRWLYGEAKSKFGALSSHADCVIAHKTFHVEAGKVATAINAKRFAEAGALIAPGSQYFVASNMIGIAIMRLKKESAFAAPT